MMTWLIPSAVALVAFVATGAVWRSRRRRRRHVSRETPPQFIPADVLQATRRGRRQLDREWMGHVHPDTRPARPPRGVTHGYGATLYFGRNLARRTSSGDDPSGLPGHQLYRRP